MEAQLVLDMHRETMAYEKRLTMLELSAQGTDKRIEQIENYIKQQNQNRDQTSNAEMAAKLARLAELEEKLAKIDTE